MDLFDATQFRKERQAYLDEIRLLTQYDFLTVPPQRQHKRRISNFIKEALALDQICTCIVCSCECHISSSKYLKLSNIPNSTLLMTNGREQAHENRLLLDTLAVTWDPLYGGYGSVCNPCHTYLSSNQLPPTALASGFWTGTPPPSLSGLTIAEKMLIARRSPGIYVLYDTKKVLVDTFHDVVGFRDYRQQPPPHRINNTLPISLSRLKSFIRMPVSGSKLNTAPECMRIRRHRVHNALLFLKKHHPFYDDIIISPQNLDQLPESAIPPEIIDHMADSRSLIHTLKVYAHRTESSYEHPSQLHQFAWMFPTLVHHLTGPMNSNDFDWRVISKWYLNHRISSWREDDFYVSWLFKCVRDQIFHHQLITHREKLHLLVAMYCATGINNAARQHLKSISDSILANIPGSCVARCQTRDLFWSISAVKCPPTFHLIIEPYLTEPVHPVSHSIFPDAIHDPTPQVKTLQNALPLILSHLLGVENSGNTTTRSSSKRGHHGVFGKISSYLTALDPDGPNGIRLHLALWITNAPPYDLFLKSMWNRNYQRSFHRYCDSVLANLDAHAPPIEDDAYTFQCPELQHPKRAERLWNKDLMRAAGVEVSVRTLTSAGDVASLSDLMSRPVCSLIPTQPDFDVFSSCTPPLGKADRRWAEKLLTVDIQSRLGEISTAEQIYYLLGGVDRYISHQTYTIDLDIVRSILLESYHDLRIPFFDDVDKLPANVCLNSTEFLSDYAARSPGLHDLNLLDFCLTTEEASSCHKWFVKRYHYMLGQGRDDRFRITTSRELLPHFTGHWIPRLDDDLTCDLHRAMVLLLLKPWRDIRDLCKTSFSWEHEWSLFMRFSDRKTLWRARNFQFIHHAQDALRENTSKVNTR